MEAVRTAEKLLTSGQEIGLAVNEGGTKRMVISRRSVDVIDLKIRQSVFVAQQTEC